MDVRKILKDFNRIDCSVFVNNRLILRLKEDAMMFLGDSEHDKEIREMCLTEARKIKAESDQLLKERADLTNAVKQLSPLQRKIFDMFYVQGLKAPACSEILGCNQSKFYQMKEELIKELERKLNEDEAHSDL